MATRERWSNRKGRESMTKKLAKGGVAGRIRERDGDKCAYCHAAALEQAKLGKPMNYDHIDAKHGWKGRGKNDPKNLVMACQRCNFIKHDMTVEEFAKYAKDKMGLSIDPAKIREQAAQPLPEQRDTQRADVKKYDVLAREHRDAAKVATDPAAKAAHEVANVVNTYARDAAKAGRLSAEHKAAAASATEHSGPGIKRDELGRFS